MNGLNISKRIKLKLKKVFYPSSLLKIAECVGGDKLYGHNYIPLYEKYFKNIRTRKLKILEIGIGGYENPLAGGESLRMWGEYFSNSQLIGADLFPKTLNLPSNVKTVELDQSDLSQIEDLGVMYGPFDIIIDDGSHVSKHVIDTFKILFNYLNIEGYYFVEDTQTAYWPDFGGSLDNDEKRCTNFFKSLTDGLNFSEYLIANYKPTKFDKYINFIHFYHNIIVISKDHNNIKSNLVENGKINI
jgi:hypothetical protein